MRVIGNLSEYADQELRTAGYDPDSPEFVKATIYRNVMDLIHTFEGQRHSGMSAGWVMSIFHSLASFKPLGPLTGEADEWELVDESRDLWQNRRSHRVFRERGEAYDSLGRAFMGGDGVAYTSKESRTPITFPYTPATEVVMRDAT